MNNINIEMPMKVAPSGFPTCRNRAWGVSVSEEEEDEFGVEPDIVVLRRKSWVTAMPMEAKERDVRSQARKVRSMPWLAFSLIPLPVPIPVPLPLPY